MPIFQAKWPDPKVRSGLDTERTPLSVPGPFHAGGFSKGRSEGRDHGGALDGGRDLRRVHAGTLEKVEKKHAFCPDSKKYCQGAILCKREQLMRSINTIANDWEEQQKTGGADRTGKSTKVSWPSWSGFLQSKVEFYLVFRSCG